MKSTSTLSFLVLFCGLALFGAAAADCELPGTCGSAGDDNFVANGFTDDVGECEDLCDGQSSCSFYTWYPSDGRCNLYSSCPEPPSTSACPDCTSGGPFDDCSGDGGDGGDGDVGCDQPYQCSGDILDVFDDTSDLDTCDSFCASISGCSAYTWYGDEEVCLLWSSCELQSSSCSGCTTGEPGCES